MNYQLKILNDLYAICRLNSDDDIPEWINKKAFYSITKTSEELSILCLQENIPAEIKCEKDWKILKIDSKLDFSIVGVISELSKILAQNNISIFVISTFDTDYICVKEKDLCLTTEVLEKNLYVITSDKKT